MKLDPTMFTENWHTMRWVALSIGLFLGLMAFLNDDIITALFSVFFLFQAISNKGCMVSQGCYTSTKIQPQSKEENSSIEYTEVH